MTETKEEGVERAAEEWVAVRHRAGNWYDIAPTEEIPRAIRPELYTVFQMFQFRFAPEIRKRLADGRVDESFELRTAQFVQWGDAPAEVRFNEEIRGEAAVRANRDVSEGDGVQVRDFDGIEGFDLHAEEMDAGHCTLFRGTDGDWRVFFDFRMWRREVGKHLEVATEFLSVARLSYANGHQRGSIDALLVACEHIAKAHLVLHHHVGVRSSKTHKAIRSAINRWSHLGNVDTDFTELLNRLAEDWNPARYDLDADVTPPSEEDLELVEAELRGLGESVASRVAGVVARQS